MRIYCGYDARERHKNELQERLINWAAYMRSRPPQRTACGSAEHYYRSPQIWHAEGIRRDPDVQDALTIERAITTLHRASNAAAEALVSHYLYRSRPEVVVRRLRLESVQAYTELLDEAHDHLQSILDGYTVALPLTSEQLAPRGLFVL